MGIVHYGEKNPFWKGGRTIASNGYVLIKRTGHPMADVRGYVYEHRLVASEILGRLLLGGEQVHHKNGDKTDNRPENIEVVPSRKHHAVKHRPRFPDRRRKPDEPNPTVECECGCGTTFERYDEQGRPREFVTSHNAKHGPNGRFE